MFESLLENKVPYVLWTLNQELFIHKIKYRSLSANFTKTIFRTFLESTDYILYIHLSQFTEEIKNKIQQFTQGCTNLCEKRQKKLVNPFRLENSLQEIKVYSWKNSLFSIKEILFAFSENNKYITPIIYLSDRLGGPVITPKSDRFFFKNQLSEKQCIEETQDTPDVILCSVCMCHKKNVLFEPCNHITCCPHCSNKLDMCPLCKKTIKQNSIVFL